MKIENLIPNSLDKNGAMKIGYSDFFIKLESDLEFTLKTGI